MKKIQCKKYVCLLAGVLLVMVLSSGCSLQQAGNASDETWGRSDAKEIDINSKVAGRVIQLNVKEGDTVHKGDVIAYIDQRDLLAQKAQAEANIKALEAQVRQADVVTTLQDSTSHSTLDTASAGIDTAQSNLDLAEKDFNRYQELYQQGAVSKAVFDGYKTKYEVAQAAYSQAQSGYASAQAGLLQTDVNTANADAVQKKLEAAHAQLQQIEVSLDETRLKEFRLGQQVPLLARDGKTKVTGTITDISKKSEFATQRATSERGDDTDIISFNIKVQVNDSFLRPGMRFRLLAGEAV
ncbi:biotin/lipoyl-binding protein [uncultured Megasphaera sp.]|uniref:HlyD family secretion protein n=1 Tax=uncultured Megasphaera sp. TaxID=165188 RepID=UPI0025E2A627|nr:biotin/lipoyl-binding protein [uncultured Megasphaera sp.]